MSESIVSSQPQCTETSGCPTPVASDPTLKALWSNAPKQTTDALCLDGTTDSRRRVNHTVYRRIRGRFRFQYDSVKIPNFTPSTAPAAIAPNPVPTSRSGPPPKCDKGWDLRAVEDLECLLDDGVGYTPLIALELVECSKDSKTGDLSDCYSRNDFSASTNSCDREFEKRKAYLRSKAEKLGAPLDGTGSTQGVSSFHAVDGEEGKPYSFANSDGFRVTWDSKNFCGFYSIKEDVEKLLATSDKSDCTADPQDCEADQNTCKIFPNVIKLNAGCSALKSERTFFLLGAKERAVDAGVGQDIPPECCSTGPSYNGGVCCATDNNYNLACCQNPEGDDCHCPGTPPECCTSGDHYNPICCIGHAEYNEACCQNPDSDECICGDTPLVCCGYSTQYNYYCCADPNGACCADQYSDACACGEGGSAYCLRASGSSDAIVCYEGDCTGVCGAPFCTPADCNGASAPWVTYTWWLHDGPCTLADASPPPAPFWSIGPYNDGGTWYCSDYELLEETHCY